MLFNRTPIVLAAAVQPSAIAMVDQRLMLQNLPPVNYTAAPRLITTMQYCPPREDDVPRNAELCTNEVSPYPLFTKSGKQGYTKFRLHPAITQRLNERLKSKRNGELEADSAVAVTEAKDDTWDDDVTEREPMDAKESTPHGPTTVVSDSLVDFAVSQVTEAAIHHYRATGFPFFPRSPQALAAKFDNIYRRTAFDWCQLEVDHENFCLLPGKCSALTSVLNAYFPHMYAVRCNNSPTPLEAFHKDNILRAFLNRALTKETVGSLSDSRVRSRLKSFRGSQGVSNFRPTAAAAIYGLFGGAYGGRVWDMSCGWGGRLLGAHLAGVKEYVGCEPSTLTYEGLQQFADDFLRREPIYRSQPAGNQVDHESLMTKFVHTSKKGRRGPRTRKAKTQKPEDVASCRSPVIWERPRNMDVTIHKLGSESFRPDPDSLDLAFTSPPYFATEVYSNEATQSCNKFSKPDSWANDFLYQTFLNAFWGLKPGCKMVVNIANTVTYQTAVKDTVRTAEAVGFVQAFPHWSLVLPSHGSRNRSEPVLVFQKPDTAAAYHGNR